MPKIIDHDETRDTIADAFVRVISAKGSAGATMREIAREAGCSQTLPLYYFDNRQALVEFAFSRQADMAVEGLRGIVEGAGSAANRLQATLEWLIARSSSSAMVWRTIIGMIVEDNGNSRIGELDRKCYNAFLAALTGLVAEFDPARDARGDAILLLTCTDGLAFATASLTGEENDLAGSLLATLLDRYGLAVR